MQKGVGEKDRESIGSQYAKIVQALNEDLSVRFRELHDLIHHCVLCLFRVHLFDCLERFGHLFQAECMKLDLSPDKLFQEFLRFHHARLFELGKSFVKACLLSFDEILWNERLNGSKYQAASKRVGDREELQRDVNTPFLPRNDPLAADMYSRQCLAFGMQPERACSSQTFA